MQIRWVMRDGMLMAKEIALTGGVTAQAIVAQVNGAWQWGVRMRDNDNPAGEWAEHAEPCIGLDDGLARANDHLEKAERAAEHLEQLATEN